MARALISNVQVAPDPANANTLVFTWVTIYVGADVRAANVQRRRDAAALMPAGERETVAESNERAALLDFDTEPTISVTAGMPMQTAKTAIRDAIQARATALGYGELQGTPQHVDELFYGL